MLGRKTLSTDVTLTAPTDFVTAQLAAGELLLGFQVEEAEMLIDLVASLSYEGSAAGLVTFTIFVDGAAAAVADVPAAGLWRTEIVATTVGMQQMAVPAITLRLAKGFHTCEVRASASAGNVVFLGSTGVPCTITARRHSHPATLGHGVDSKAMLIQ
jgi:hypothetical protein